MTREQLESFVSHIQLELEREREERNFFQLERDKIKTFWEITRQQLEENRACLKYVFRRTLPYKIERTYLRVKCH